MGWLPGDRVSQQERCLHPEPGRQAPESLLSRAARGPARSPAEELRGRRRDRDSHGERSGLRCTAVAPAPGSVTRRKARYRDTCILRRIRRARAGNTQSHDTTPGRAPKGSGRAACQGEASSPHHADDARSGDRARLAEAVRRSGPRRRHRQAGIGQLSTRKARNDQGEARAYGRLRRSGVSLAQERQRRGGLAIARTLRRRRRTSARRCDLFIYDGDAQAARERFRAASKERWRGSPVA